ncbi:amino acid ABC transporter ATP-binding protein [Lactococcus chungangensis]|jgi:ABC-type polar amino acid transport system, ATPase component|uniref:Amino acid ABC transporter ATP-binding protein, PAAT family (TC 3.A.1.3.-) n=2 Tax=Pseudolactococcus chungangensis TaxID=451457 RepID=A0A1K2H4F9_9LACT|nr:amino acid ABC transporter ATP-binding protein [Lactococcus chungangensis]MDD3014943.1 amino acid ABC transporter ATP-binding protein [Lactococcus chungangensis]NCB82349.1 amino acid ABC transporter ATP-binding protein [Bacilli bacterium]NLH35653.1 amino acid ABC transporter ATP-binding protein [Lactococcus chungangensis]SFZ70041.1 amino acid ABC transporter ATP-binding protein, PAAT family (TC 3.A.1.3.-) [Lactococcus chungangensis CAU 28 = DSM 22330]
MTIKLSNLYKKFGDTVVLDDVSLEIEPGDVIALIGASGAGKSTFLRSINYLEVPDSGHVDIDDLHLDFANINKDDILNLRRKTAMVFQQFNLFERRTALENVMEGLIQVKKIDKVTAAEQAAQELIKVGLSDRMAYYPKFLSGGQKQRVGIARALAMKPALLLLDEPTSALDPELVSEVQASIIQAAKSGQTMIIVSHEMDFVYHVASKVIFLEQGKIIESGTPEDVFYAPKHPRTKEFLARHTKNLEIGSFL